MLLCQPKVGFQAELDIASSGEMGGVSQGNWPGHLKINKEAAGRHKDLDDLENLP